MPVSLQLILVLSCVIPIAGVCMFLFSKKTTWKVTGAVFFIVGTIIFIHEGIGHTIMAYLNF